MMKRILSVLSCHSILLTNVNYSNGNMACCDESKNELVADLKHSSTTKANSASKKKYKLKYKKIYNHDSNSADHNIRKKKHDQLRNSDSNRRNNNITIPQYIDIILDGNTTNHISLLISDYVTSTATSVIKESQPIANTIAKDLVLHILGKKKELRAEDISVSGNNNSDGNMDESSETSETVDVGTETKHFPGSKSFSFPELELKFPNVMRTLPSLSELEFDQFDDEITNSELDCASQNGVSEVEVEVEPIPEVDYELLFGTVLHSIFTSNTFVQDFAREYSYWALESPTTLYNSTWQVNWQRDYYLIRPGYRKDPSLGYKTMGEDFYLGLGYYELYDDTVKQIVALTGGDAAARRRKARARARAKAQGVIPHEEENEKPLLVDQLSSQLVEQLFKLCGVGNGPPQDDAELDAEVDIQKDKVSYSAYKQAILNNIYTLFLAKQEKNAKELVPVITKAKRELTTKSSMLLTAEAYADSILNQMVRTHGYPLLEKNGEEVIVHAITNYLSSTAARDMVKESIIQYIQEQYNHKETNPNDQKS